MDLIQLDDFDIRERTNYYDTITEEDRATWQRMWTEVTAG